MIEISQLAGLTYIDNCDMIQPDDDIESTHLQIQLAISEWEDLIIITGGCLSQDKSALHLAD